MPDSPHKLSGLHDLAANYDVILSDVWGVIHNGIHAFPKACDALQRFRHQGGKVILLTNAPRPGQVIITQLDGFGVPRDAYDGIVSSGDITISLIKERQALSLFKIGPRSDDVLYTEAERHIVTPLRFAPADQADYLVCTGLFDELRERPEDYDPLLRAPAAAGRELICANPDIVVRIGDELVACAGAIAERYQALGGKVLQAGKPFDAIYVRALSLAGRTPSQSSRVLAIGDAMHTDIEGAHRQGLDNVFITSGIHRSVLHHPERGDLDAAALRQFLQGSEAPPMAVMPELIW
ncbi:TIGR01459 family HAD-type hydrolase [Beijerinckia indica]|uniref:TIGR01459 family HAD-type hydrolase n=1 Tax=Beijerinckia indica TaxID=533 RepID=UPI0005A0B78F|nr:TIGR01459 family HAD-type hydrolase [Beijerinckia indica]